MVDTTGPGATGRAPSNSRWWIITWSCAVQPSEPSLPADAEYIVGQQEEGAGGFLHWQFVVRFKRCFRLPAVKRCFPGAHCEPTRSDAAVEYVQKEETRVPGTSFSHGRKPMQRGNKTDWDAVFNAAVAGDWDAVPRDILIRNYGNLRKIHQERNAPPERFGVSTEVYIGVTGSGKTYKAYQEMKALGDWYVKCSRTKWWDGYMGQRNVLIDEFAGCIDITYMLRWLDWYPCQVEVKGGTVNLAATRFWITSNLTLEEWYPQASPQHLAALRRRVVVREFTEPYVAEEEEAELVGDQTQEINELFAL